MAVKSFKCDPRTVVANTMTVVGAATALEALIKAQEGPEGKPATEPRLTTSATGQAVVLRFKLPTEAKELIEKNSGKCIGARVWTYAENRGTSGKDIKISCIEPALGTVQEPELAKNTGAWAPVLGGPVVSKAEAEEKLTTISKIEEQNVRIERITAKELWVFECYLQVEIEYTEGGPTFSESFVETVGVKQVIAGAKRVLGSFTQTTAPAQAFTGLKKATSTSTQTFAPTQAFTGLKKSTATSTQTLALIQQFVGEEAKGPRFTEAFLQTYAVKQTIAGSKRALAAMAQTAATAQNFVGLKKASASVTQTTIQSQVFTGQKRATGSFTQRVAPLQKMAGFKKATGSYTQTVGFTTKLTGYKIGKGAATQTVALIQVIPQPAPPAPEPLHWLYASVQEPLPYSHTVQTPAPYPVTVGEPQPYPLDVEMD